MASASIGINENRRNYAIGVAPINQYEISYHLNQHQAHQPAKPSENIGINGEARHQKTASHQWHGISLSRKGERRNGVAWQWQANGENISMAA